jgi:hypothetical protein
MAYSQTFAQIADTITVLFRNMTGKSNPTYLERGIIENAVNEALQQICMERGTAWNFLRTSTTLTTVADQAYVDLSSDVFNVVAGSVRLPEEETRLSWTTLEAIRNINPGNDETGQPFFYAFISSGTPDAMRLQLYPIPDAIFTIHLDVDTLVAEDASTSLPSWFVGAVTDLATAITQRRLGFGNPALYQANFENTLQNLRDVESGDGGITVTKTTPYYVPYQIQRRAKGSN